MLPGDFWSQVLLLYFVWFDTIPFVLRHHISSALAKPIWTPVNGAKVRWDILLGKFQMGDGLLCSSLPSSIGNLSLRFRGTFRNGESDVENQCCPVVFTAVTRYADR